MHVNSSTNSNADTRTHAHMYAHKVQVAETARDVGNHVGVIW